MINPSTIQYAASGTAWKTSSMKGFIYKTVLAAETYGEGAYKLTFRKAANVNGNPVDYDFYFNVDTSVYTGTIPDATDLVLDKELLGHILDTNWIAGTVDEYEAARTGNGTW